MIKYKPIIKDGIIIEGGFGKPLDYYSKEAQQQRKDQLKEKINNLIDEYLSD